MPVIVGAPRSGTTLLRFMLDAHPLLAIPPETGFLPSVAALANRPDASPEDLIALVTDYPHDAPNWSDFGLGVEELRVAIRSLPEFSVREGLRCFYRLYAARQGKPRYGEKTPLYGEHIAEIEALLPEARLVHIIRDGRDVALSLRKVWFSPAQDIPALAQYWRRVVEAARVGGRRANAYLELRYEDLIREARPQLERICAFLDLDFHPGMLSYYQRTHHRLEEHGTRVRRDGSVAVTHEQRLVQQRLTMQPPRPERLMRWKNEMSGAERAEFAHHSGGLLSALGYED